MSWWEAAEKDSPDFWCRWCTAQRVANRDRRTLIGRFECVPSVTALVFSWLLCKSKQSHSWWKGICSASQKPKPPLSRQGQIVVGHTIVHLQVQIKAQLSSLEWHEKHMILVDQLWVYIPVLPYAPCGTIRSVHDGKFNNMEFLCCNEAYLGNFSQYCIRFLLSSMLSMLNLEED